MGGKPLDVLNFRMNSAVAMLVQYSDHKSGQSMEKLDKKLRSKICHAENTEIQVCFGTSMNCL